MPITLPAHQVAILPLLSFRRLPPLALVVGSCVPDLTYLWPPNPVSIWAHQPVGAMLLAVSLGLLFYLWAAYLLLPTLSRTLPTCAGIEWARFATIPKRRPAWGWVLWSLVLGAWSHVLLDSLTHATLWPGSLLHQVSWWGVHVTQWLQRVLSLFGSLAVLWFLARAYPTLPRPNTAASSLHLRRLLVFFLVGACSGVSIVIFREQPAYPFRLFWSSVAWGLMGLTFACLWVRRRTTSS